MSGRFARPIIRRCSSSLCGPSARSRKCCRRLTPPVAVRLAAKGLGLRARAGARRPDAFPGRGTLCLHRGLSGGPSGGRARGRFPAGFRAAGAPGRGGSGIERVFHGKRTQRTAFAASRSRASRRWRSCAWSNWAPGAQPRSPIGPGSRSDGYIDRYVIADAASNPFGIGPYGVYFNPPSPELQVFRDAGRGRGVRTFIHPFNPQEIVHGTGGVVMHQASLCAKAGSLFGRRDWQRAAERMVQWTLGHNPEGLCLHHGVGYRHPTPFFGVRHPASRQSQRGAT